MVHRADVDRRQLGDLGLLVVQGRLLHSIGHTGLRPHVARGEPGNGLVRLLDAVTVSPGELYPLFRDGQICRVRPIHLEQRRRVRPPLPGHHLGLQVGVRPCVGALAILRSSVAGDVFAIHPFNLVRAVERAHQVQRGARRHGARESVGHGPRYLQRYRRRTGILDQAHHLAHRVSTAAHQDPITRPSIGHVGSRPHCQVHDRVSQLRQGICQDGQRGKRCAPFQLAIGRGCGARRIEEQAIIHVRPGEWPRTCETRVAGARRHTGDLCLAQVFHKQRIWQVEHGHIVEIDRRLDRVFPATGWRYGGDVVRR